MGLVRAGRVLVRPVNLPGDGREAGAGEHLAGSMWGGGLAVSRFECRLLGGKRTYATGVLGSRSNNPPDQQAETDTATTRARVTPNGRMAR